MVVLRKSGIYTVSLKSEIESQSTLLAAKVKDNKGKEINQHQALKN